MNIERHGISIGMERVGSKFFLSIKAIGKLTHEDYNMINPIIDSALEGVKNPVVTVFIDASEFEGWNLRAAWDDFRLALKHGNEFDKVAILGNKSWQNLASKIASWFISGEVEYFDDSDAALEWLQQ